MDNHDYYYDAFKSYIEKKAKIQDTRIRYQQDSEVYAPRTFKYAQQMPRLGKPEVEPERPENPNRAQEVLKKVGIGLTTPEEIQKWREERKQ